MTYTARRPVAAPPKRGWASPLLWLATVAMGLMAGLFYAFSVSVMPGLAQADDRAFVLVMNRINQAIENPLFGLTFSGAFVLTVAAAIAQYRMGLRAAARWTLAALALYIVALAITMGVNVPLNDELAKAAEDFTAARDNFEGLWNVTNNVRGLACTLALACLARSLTLQGRGERA
ncbi:anthrone oxygenase family protein [Nonomuraea sp. B12E4]|uniref:anthrone oxygenase family protein n=1 Tax=Nonomuraea sp. B12E4 TaxID=3153564 RepID=UPI00325D0047